MMRAWKQKYHSRKILKIEQEQKYRYQVEKLKNNILPRFLPIVYVDAFFQSTKADWKQW